MTTDTLNNPAVFQDQAAATPPSQFNANANDGRYYFSSSSAEHIAHNGSNTLDTPLRLRVEILTAPSSGEIYLQYDLAAGGVQSTQVGSAGAVGTYDFTLTDHDTAAAGFRLGFASNNGTDYQGLANGGVVAVREILAAAPDFNCEYEVDANAETLATVRAAVLSRTGYAAQLASLPPGVEALYNDFCADAQESLYRMFPALQTERYFTWQMVPPAGTTAAIRYYGLQNNIDYATVRLDRFKITSADIQDLNNRWYPLTRGIDPELYTVVNNIGWPSRFEVRSCIEVFPAPQAAYKLRVLGQFGLSAFAADGDYTTIDAHPVRLWAIGLAKAHKGARDAGDPVRMTGYFGMARRAMLDRIGNMHAGRRYVPGTDNRATRAQPVMVEFIP